MRWAWRRPRCTRSRPSITTSTCVKEGDTPPPRADGARLRRSVLRDGRRARRCWTRLPALLGREVRVISRAVHRPLRAGAGRGRGPAPGGAGHGRGRAGGGAGRARDAPARSGCIGLRRLPGRWRLCAAARLRRRPARGRCGDRARWSIRACAAWAAPAFRPGASGASCAPSPAPRLMAVNIDEGEPGTFKDRVYLERDPHRFLEGMLIAAWAVGIDAHLHLPARRIPRLPRACCEAELRQAARAAAAGPACRPSSCAAAPAPTSAAKSRR